MNLIGKPVPTFPDHALTLAKVVSGASPWDKRVGEPCKDRKKACAYEG
jgi:hypothetical protein